MKSAFRILAYLALSLPTVACLTSATPAKAATADVRKAFEADVQPVLMQFCVRCHGGTKQEADLRLDKLHFDLVAGPDAETWHDVLNKLNLGEMPPKKEPQPREAQRQKVVAWLTGELRRLAEAKRSTGGRVVLRRLTRYEYNNTMRDLLGVHLDYGKDLPPESTSADGFLNNGSAMGISPLQIETYLAAARRGLRQAIVTGSKPTVVHKQAKTSDQVRRVKGKVSNRLEPGMQFLLRTLEFPREGDFLVRIKAGATIPDGTGSPRMRVTLGLRSDTKAPAKIIGSDVDVTASPDDPATFEFRGRMEEFPLPGAKPKFPGVQVTVWNTYGITGPLTAKKPKKKKGQSKNKGQPQNAAAKSTPEIIIDSIEFTAPVLTTWPPPTHTRIFLESDARDDESKYAREIVEHFLERAFRRPVVAADVDPVMAFFAQVRPRFDTLEETMQEVLAMTLVSPDFLYLVEPADGASEKQPLSDFEFASRLSYFLWSTMPDEELVVLAASGKLREPATIQQQVRRMIADSRSWNFVEQFTDQWLDLSGMTRVAVNPQYYPKFDETLKNDMRQETQHFFAEILRSDLSALNLIDSDFAMLNARLAKHYGIDAPAGGEFGRVALEPESHRGGLLTQGSMLLTNSNGEDSHPIRRAVWLLERLLDDPPPPPPPDVPDLDTEQPNIAALPVKRQLELHRTKTACNSCHRGIDPWGIPLENFDAVGRWRTDVRRLVGKKQQLAPVVAQATLPGGHQVQGVAELKRHLRNHEQARFSRAVTKKLLAYGLGRSVELSDFATVEKLSDRFADSGFRLRDLIVAIVQSEEFQSK